MRLRKNRTYPSPSEHELQEWLRDYLAIRTKIARDAIDIDSPFAALGVDSRQAVSMAGALEEWLGRECPPTLAWECPTIREIARHLGGTERSAPGSSRN